MDYSRPDLADRLAAEYVVGLLRGPARRRFEALVPAHPILRRAMDDWRERLMPLSAEIEPQTPSPDLWPRIEARIHGPASGASPAVEARGGGGWWRGLAFWRGVSTVAGVAAVVLAVMLANPGPDKPPIVVVLSAAAPASAVTPASFVAGISADGRAIVTRPLTRVSLQPDRSLQLWALPPGGAPRSLGLISADSPTVVERDKVLQGADSLAVSLEAQGGSTDGKPHGPILYVGKLGNR